MKLSIVATLYQSAPYVEEFHRRATDAARRLSDEYEIVLVNDGSPDESLVLAKRIADHDHHVVVVDLSRNFGHHKAMMTGLAHSRGERVFLIDSDLEEDPAWVGPFWKQLTEQNCDVVYGVQEQRKGKTFERLSGQWFYSLFRFLTGLTLPANVATARLMTRRYVDALTRFDEREVFIAGLWHITGFDQRSQTVRKAGKDSTTYTLRRKISLLVNSVTSFSNAPLAGIFYVGVAISAMACAYSAYLVFRWAFLNRPLAGWTSVMASVWLIGGMMISFIGVIGIYLSKMFSETKRRPYTIIREVYGQRRQS